MKYIEVKIFTDALEVEKLTADLTELGFTELVIDDPAEITRQLEKKKTYDWDYIDEKALDISGNEAGVTLYLDDTEAGWQTLHNIKSAVGGKRVENKIVDDGDWKNIWKEYFKPFKVSNRIVIKPTWEEYEGNGNELIIKIDPGMAFGTGAHSTTSMCIKLMEKNAGQFKSVLDVGCGSGILSIAAALLGAEDVLGVEIDTEAVVIAGENVELNGLGNKVRIVHGDLTKGIDFKADLITANLMADLIILLAEGIKKNLTPEGLFISSGILIEKMDEVRAGIKDVGFEIIDIIEENDWCAILARLRKS